LFPVRLLLPLVDTPRKNSAAFWRKGQEDLRTTVGGWWRGAPHSAGHWNRTPCDASTISELESTWCDHN